MFHVMNRMSVMEQFKYSVVLIVLVTYHPSQSQITLHSLSQSAADASTAVYESSTLSSRENSTVISTSSYFSSRESSFLVESSISSYVVSVTPLSLVSSDSTNNRSTYETSMAITSTPVGSTYYSDRTSVSLSTMTSRILPATSVADFASPLLLSNTISSRHTTTISSLLGTSYASNATSSSSGKSIILKLNSSLSLFSSSGPLSITSYSSYTTPTPIALNSSSTPGMINNMSSTRSEKSSLAMTTTLLKTTEPNNTEVSSSVNYNKMTSFPSVSGDSVPSTTSMTSLVPSTLSRTILPKATVNSTAQSTSAFVTSYSSFQPLLSPSHSYISSLMSSSVLQLRVSSSLKSSTQTSNFTVTNTSLRRQPTTTSKLYISRIEDSSSSALSLSIAASTLHAISSSVMLLQPSTVSQSSASTSDTHIDLSESPASMQSHSIVSANTTNIGRTGAPTTTSMKSSVTSISTSSSSTLSSSSVKPTGPAPNGDNNDNQKQIIMIAAGSGGGGIFLCILIGCICMIRRKKRNDEQRSLESEDAKEEESRSDLKAHWNTLRKNNNLRKSLMAIGEDMYSDADEGIELDTKEKSDPSILSISSEAVAESNADKNAGDELRTRCGTFTSTVKPRRNEGSLIDLLNGKGVSENTELSKGGEAQVSNNKSGEKMMTFKRSDRSVEKSDEAAEESLLQNDADVQNENEDEPLPDLSTLPPPITEDDEPEGPVKEDAVLPPTNTDGLKIGIDNPSLQLDSEDDEKKRLSEYYC